MRILLDECAPRRLRRGLTGPHGRPRPGMGWSGKKNGELLHLMTANGFECLLTVDQNLRFQQNLQNADVAVVVLVAASTRLADLMPLLPAALVALSSVQPGQVVEVTA